MSIPDVLVVGAGPSGLATAIAAKRHGLEYAIIEKGVLVNSIFNFPTHMVYFTTPELLEIGGLPLVTPFEKPTRLESLRYYRRVVDTYGIQASFHREVTDIARQGDVFVVTTSSVPPGSRRANGSEDRASWRARAVVLAIGYYDIPNTLGVPGEQLPHVSH
ncbi:MAG TPA: NAD(P)-binding domain-containing protein, partial [Vicinamibacterales bacterium]|nr:NAD(P)-binding domain-containing protein [Vicinamibacterales bacterium]